MDSLGLFIVSNMTIIFLGLLSYYLNNYSNSGIYFGVRIPNKFKGIEEIKILEKEYKRIILISFLLLIIVFNLVMLLIRNRGEEITSLVSGVTIVITLLIHELIFVIYNKKTKRIKKEKDLNYKSNNVVIVDTTLRKPKINEKYKALNDRIYLVPIIIPILLLFLTFINKEYIFKLGLYEMYRIPIIEILMCIFMYLLAKISLRSKVDLNSLDRKSTIAKKKKIKKYISIFFLVSEVEVILLYSLVQLGIIYKFYTTNLIIYINIFISISMIFLVCILLIIGSFSRGEIGKVNKEEDYRDDDENWVWGMFYFNKNDPAVMIEKRVGIGYTVNFANKKSWVLFGFTILFVILISFL